MAKQSDIQQAEVPVNKEIKGIKMKNGMDEVLTTTGVLSASGKYVVAAQGRFNSQMKWNPSKRTVGTDSRIPMRLDISVSHYEKDVQGSFLMPYLSGRVVQIKGSFGSRTIIATPFDNDTNRQYKNALIEQDIWDAMKVAIKLAITDAIESAKTGKVSASAANSEFIDNADDFLAMAEKVAHSTLQKVMTQNTGVATPSATNAAIVDKLLGGDQPQA